MDELGDAGVISVGMLAEIRRMHLRDGLSIREVSRRMGLSRNTVRKWLRQEGVTEPKYPKRAQFRALDACAKQPQGALSNDRRGSALVDRQQLLTIAVN
jgi:DNA-binding transcriptional regulator YiaG